MDLFSVVLKNLTSPMPSSEGIKSMKITLGELLESSFILVDRLAQALQNEFKLYKSS